jgi:hypothetical protein
MKIPDMEEIVGGKEEFSLQDMCGANTELDRTAINEILVSLDRTGTVVGLRTR